LYFVSPSPTVAIATGVIKPARVTVLECTYPLANAADRQTPWPNFAIVAFSPFATSPF